MTRPQDWDESDLLKLIADQVQESRTLDYKACGALGKSNGKKDEISKDVSAFANSAGGTIVYGMIESGHLPDRLDVGFDPDDFSREWLEQVINSRVHPRIPGIVIRPVPLVSTSPGRVAYVVCVPQSDTAHQASDKRYYKRFNFQSVMMEDYEVRDTMSRAKQPRVVLKQVLARRVSSSRTRGRFSYEVWLSVDVENCGKVIAERFSVEVAVPKALAINHEGGFMFPDHRPQKVDQHAATFLLTGTSPLYPEQTQRLGEAPVKVTERNAPAARTAVFRVRVFAGDAAPCSSEVPASELAAFRQIVAEIDSGQ